MTPKNKPSSPGELPERIVQLEAMVQDCSRAIRGYDGDPGIIGRLSTLESLFDRFVSNDFPHMKEELMEKLADAQKESLQWRPIWKEFVAPIIVAVITALLISGVVDRVLTK